MQRDKIQNNTDSVLEGGPINHWNDLSIQEKAAMMDVAIRNGITDLKDIRDKYNEFAEGGDIYPSEEVNEFGRGGYKPSERIKKRISNWEGAAMYKDTIDPLSGKMAKKNAPFETVTSGFVSVLPSSIRERVLSNQELADNLFSYAYNVGSGRFRERVVPTLIKYYSGQATANDIAQSMWASGDAKLRGLRNRRAEERAGVLSALGANPVADVPIPETTVPAFMPSNPQAFFNPIASYTPSEVVVPTETESPLATYDPEELKRREQAQYRNNFTTMMSLLYPQGNSMDLLSMLTNNTYSKGGGIHINPSKKGTFTAAATKHGMGVQEFASKVLANKDDYSPAMVKKANFARNFGGKKHSYGGNLFDDGGIFSRIKNYYHRNMEKLGLEYRKRPSENIQGRILPKRVRENTSSTKMQSEKLENKMRGYVVDNQKIHSSNPDYDIPFIPEKAILLNGSTTSTNVLDSMAKYAGIYNNHPQLSQHTIKKRSTYAAPRQINRDEMLGLAALETHMGAMPYFNLENGNPQYNRALANSNYFTSFGYLPAENMIRNFHYNKTKVDATVPPLLDAFQYYSQGDYNRGNPNHTKEVNATGKELWKNPKVKDWWETSGKYWYNLGYNPYE